MGAFVRLYKYFNLLSIDIAIGTVAGASFFASLLEVAVRPYAYLSLGITVWIIYTTDHLFDARKIKTVASTARHRFHQRNFNVLSVFVLLAIAVDLVLILFVKKPVLYGGFLIASVVGLYLIVHRQLAFLKEAVVATLYSAGILLPSVTVTSTDLSPDHYILFVLFFTTALINLLMFSWFDLKNDLADETQSFVTVMGDKRTLRVLWLIFMLNAALCIYFLYERQHINHAIIIIVMNATLLIILVFRKWFVSHDRYRLLGDAVFLFPFIGILLE
jgi:4-hydroxybenzoate polyprenyltransferase